MAETKIIAKSVKLENPDADFETLKKEVMAKVKPDDEVERDVALSAGETVLADTRFVNLTKDRIHIIDKHFWSGSLINEVPYLGPETYVGLYQKGPAAEGVKWGVAWANGDDSTARKLVVAVDTAANKVYVETGPTGPVDWNVVEVKLGMSGNRSEYTDPILGGEVVATIDGLHSYAQFR